MTPSARRGFSTAGRRAATLAKASELRSTVSHDDAFAISWRTAFEAASSDVVAPRVRYAFKKWCAFVEPVAG